MKKYDILFIIVLFVTGFVFGMCFDKHEPTPTNNNSWSEAKKDSIIDTYEWYFISVEELLDTLDNRYDWIDTYDPQEYYYYIEKLDSLYNE